MRVRDLRSQLDNRNDDDEITLGELIAMHPVVDESYLEDVLHQWEQIAEIFGRRFPPEVAYLVDSLRDQL